MEQYGPAPKAATDQEAAGLEALAAALDTASAYARITAMTDVAETARHNYRNAQLAHELAQEAVKTAAAVPASLITRLKEVEAQLRALEHQLA